KWYIAEGAIVSPMPVPVFTWLVPTILLISAPLTAGYLLPPAVRAFFGGFSDGEAVPVLPPAEPTRMMTVPVLILTAAIAVLGIYPGFMINTFTDLAKALF
ncbi:MAG TPA: proton-conducting membrane transporter, partial [Clostridiales bacterium]|nr:proton-conducting membrane transporter [Clostridiales bacterium]